MTTTNPIATTNPLDGQVTRPDSFDPSKDYAVVIARGDHPLGDYDVIDAQKILRYDLATFGQQLLNEGAILAEAGGTIGTAEQDVNIGGDLCGTTGTYVGTQSQVYTIVLLTSGAGGEAQYTWSSSGLDNPQYVNQPFPVPAVAPDIGTGLANLALYGCPVGSLGMVVVFANPTGRVHGASSWTIQATFGSRPPVVNGNQITVADVLIFLAGKVHRVKGGTLTYPDASSGVSVVYAEWTRALVTNADDPTLTDPLSDEPQAYREQWTMVLRTSDTSTSTLPPNVLQRQVIPIYRWDRATDVVTAVNSIPYHIDLSKTEGALPAARLVNVDQAKTFQGMLAPRTFEPFGHFVCVPNGGNPRAYQSSNPANVGKLRITIPPVTAYISGVRYASDAPQDIELDQATDTNLVTDEPIVFHSGTLSYILGKANQGFPIAAITKCTAYVALTGQSMTRGSGTDDTLPAGTQPVVSIEAIWMGSTNYSSPTNYSLQPGGIIRWVIGSLGSGGGPIPALGQGYNVNYTYNKLMVSPADYTLTGGYIDFSAPGGALPVDGSAFQVDYTYFLWRTDGVMIRPTGEIAVIRGIPQDIKAFPVLPMYALPYCMVNVAPGTAQTTITGYNNDSLTMEDLCRMRDSLIDRMIDEARLNLASQAQARTGANLLDIITDAFATTDVADQGYNRSGIAYDATLDLVAEELSLPYVQTIAPLTYTPVNSTVRQGGAFFSIPYVHELAVDAPKWSADYAVNPYSDFRPEPPFMMLTPDRDYWVDTISLTSTDSRIVQNGHHEDWRIVGSFTTNQTQVREIPFLYMRQIAVQLAVNHLVPGENLRVRIDQKDVAITATGGTAQVDGFTVRASSNTTTDRGGDATMTATIPPLVPSGVTTFEVWGDNATPGASYPAGYTVRATATFSSNGTLRLITTQTVVTYVQNDPVAQSIIFPAPRMLSKVVIPIAATPPISPASPPLICEVRATDQSGEASSPINTVLSRVTKNPDQWAADGTAVFPDPIYQPANTYHTVVLRSASNLYRIYVSQLGGPDRVSGGFITQQQIPSGIFLDSSNNTDWTLRQDWDMRLQVYVAKCTATQAMLYYGAVNVAGATAIFLTVDQVAPDACGITWEYTIDGGSTWHAFDAFTLTEFLSVASLIQIRATLWTTDPYCTPVINMTNAQLLVLANKPAGKYVSRMVTMSHASTHVAGQVDLIQPAQAQVKIFATANDGVNWVQAATLTPANVPAPGGFTSYTFDIPGLTAPTGGANSTVRMRVDMSTTDNSRRPKVKNLYIYAL